MTHVDVAKAAALARLSLTDDERARFAADLDSIVGYVEQLMSVDVAGVEPMVQPFTLECPRRDDGAAVGAALGRAALAGSAGFVDDDGLVRVPRVIE